MYSHLRMKGEAVTKQHKQIITITQEWGEALIKTSVDLPGSEGKGHEDALNSGARCGQTKLHSPVIHQVELHISEHTHTQLQSN